MNAEIILKLEDKIAELSSSVESIKKSVNGLKINEQRYLTMNDGITPGIACKVAFDDKGLIIKAEKLQQSDIPQLQIDAIIGLRKILDDKPNVSDLENLQNEIKKNTIQKGKAIGSGIRVNYDENGLVVSTSDLKIEDIPVLPISKIDGLTDIVELIKSYHGSSSDIMTINDITIDPGTFPKITYDSNGRVLGGSKLTLDDIPMELINKLNLVESRITELASQKSVTALSKNVSNKLDANDSITPGIYTKLRVDSKGLVTQGEKLSIQDLPEINIWDIVNLEKTLRSKANQNDVIALNESLSTVINSLSKLGDINSIKRTIAMKAENSDVKEIYLQLQSLQSLMDELTAKIPNELILDQLELIQKELSNISGRVTIIEKKLNINPLI